MQKGIKIIIIIMFGLVGCTSSKTTDKIITTTPVETVENGSLETNASASENNDTSASGDQQSDASISGNKETTNKTTKNKATGNKDSSNSTSAGSSDSSDNGTNSPDEEMIKVSVAVDCKTILDNMGDLKAGYEGFVGNGIILKNTTIIVKDKATAFDVLKEALANGNVPLKSKSSGYGIYVVAIGNIDEKACGSSSGWMYQVNGKFPGVAASSYRLKDGDVMTWRFTCKQGDLN